MSSFTVKDYETILYEAIYNCDSTHNDSMKLTVPLKHKMQFISLL